MRGLVDTHCHLDAAEFDLDRDAVVAAAQQAGVAAIVLPAVETMLLLATEVAATHPEIDPRVMDQVRFSRFLEIPAASIRVEALLECRKHEDGSVHAKLLSRRQGKAMARLQEHGEILFAPAGKNDVPMAECAPAPPVAPEMMIPAEQVYRELVPFGPSYHTLQESLHLCGQVAWGRLQAPDFPHAPDRVRDSLGSPFPLDGAFHAAMQGACGALPVPAVPGPSPGPGVMRNAPRQIVARGCRSGRGSRQARRGRSRARGWG